MRGSVLSFVFENDLWAYLNTDSNDSSMDIPSQIAKRYPTKTVLVKVNLLSDNKTELDTVNEPV